MVSWLNEWAGQNRTSQWVIRWWASQIKMNTRKWSDILIKYERQHVLLRDSSFVILALLPDSLQFAHPWGSPVKSEGKTIFLLSDISNRKILNLGFLQQTMENTTSDRRAKLPRAKRGWSSIPQVKKSPLWKRRHLSLGALALKVGDLMKSQFTEVTKTQVRLGSFAVLAPCGSVAGQCITRKIWDRNSVNACVSCWTDTGWRLRQQVRVHSYWCVMPFLLSIKGLRCMRIAILPAVLSDSFALLCGRDCGCY